MSSSRVGTGGVWARSLVPLAALILLSAGAVPAWAQSGTVRGQVTQVGGEPIASAQVTVVGTRLGTFTNQSGEFLLLNVPVGTYQIEVSMLGYRTVTQTVQVAAGSVAQLRFELATAAIALDEVLVTGRAAGTARREVGTVVASITAEEFELAPVSNVTEILQSRIPGVAVLPGGGNAGQGGRIILRGVGSLTEDIEPIIYVDGVRLDNSKESWVSSDAAWTGLDDIDPEDIERIEIVKGAAAATLYGTEASAGVIQIFTKQGRGDTQRWSLRSQYGLAHAPLEYWDISIYSPWFYDNFVRTGKNYSQTLSVRGAMDGFSYNLSGTLRGRDGTLVDSFERAKSFRANMRFLPTERFTIGINNGYYTRRVRYPEEGNNGANYAYNGLRGGLRGILYAPLDLIGARERIANMGRYTASVNLTYAPFDNFNHRLTLGTEIANWDTWRYVEFGEVYDANGEMYNHRREAVTYNIDYTARLRFNPTPRILSATAFGFQAYSKEEARTRATASSFPGPGLRSIKAAGSTTGLEGRLKRISAGYFAEQQFGFDNIFFITFGLRADGHSAFGESLGYQLYPKVDASYVISDQAFWPRNIGTMRLRAAYGTAGQQPGAYAAERTWESVRAFDGQPAFTTGNIGNPDLAPEVSHELEAGFDLGLLDDRVAVEYTVYNQRTKNALFNKRFPPSQGFVQTQRANVAEIHNFGHELGIVARILQGSPLTWQARFTLSTNKNEVVSLGGAPPIDVAWSQWIREGYPVGAFFENRYIMVDGEPVLASEHYMIRDEHGNPVVNDLGDTLRVEGWDFIGQPFPKFVTSFSSNFQYKRNLTLNIVVDYKGGHHISSSTTRWVYTQKIAEGEPFYDPDDPKTHIFKPGNPVARVCHTSKDPIILKTCDTDWAVNRGNHIHPADNIRLREVAIGYRVPAATAKRFGLSGILINISGRNLWRWQKYPGLEAEANFSTNNRLSNQSYFDTPIPRQVTAGITVNF